MMAALFHDNLAQWHRLADDLEPLSPSLDAAAKAVGDSLAGGGKLLSFGNGGSAADSSHLATELVCRFEHDRSPYPALALSDSGSTLSAIGNDYQFNQTFARQIHAFAQPGDIAVALSTSGNSDNVRRGLLAANERGIATISLLGKDGGQCARLGTIELIVPHNNTARIQEAHQLLIHSLCQMIEPRLSSPQ